MTDKEPVPELSDSRPPDTPEPYDTPMWRASKKGATWGAVGGFVIAKFIMQSQTIDTPVGPVFTGNVLLLFGVCVGLGAAMCAGIAYLAMRETDDAVDPPSMGPKERLD